MDVRHIASLANIPLKTQEIEIYSPQLNRIIDYVSQLSEIDTSNSKTTYHVTGLTNVTRPDEMRPGLPLSTSISQTSRKHTNMFVVPSIFEND